MSSGDFRAVLYEATYNNTQIHPIKLQPETLQATFSNGVDTPFANSSPTGVATSPISAQVSLGRKQVGLRARYALCRWTTKPANYDGDTFKLVVPDRSNFDSIAFGFVVTYLGGTGTVIAKEPERAR